MKFDNKTFQQKYEAWKNGADYWKDIRGINLGGDTQADEPSPIIGINPGSGNDGPAQISADIFNSGVSI